MQELNGFIKLFRKFKSWGWYQDTVVKALFLHCLLSASYTEFEWMGVRYNAGEFITSIARLSKELNLTPKQVRNALDKLCKTKEIGKQTTNKFTVIKVIKWGEYQIYEPEETSKRADQGQSKDNQNANEGQQYKNIKNIENKKKEPFESAWPNVQNLADLCRQMR